MSITEKTLRPIVETWLQKWGYYVAHEVMMCGYCDLIGCKWEERIGRRIPAIQEIVAVELKIRDTTGVLQQAKINQSVADYSYAAMPLDLCARMKPKNRQRFTEVGIGLLAVSTLLGVKITIPAIKNDIQHNSNVCRRLWNFKVRHNRRATVEYKCESIK